MRAVIIAGGAVSDYDYIKTLIKPDDFLIAADSGLDHMKRLGLTADVAIGDMDSVKSGISAKEIVRLNVMKDETDTEAATLMAKERGADEILILAARGSRADHTTANMLLLKRLDVLGKKAHIADENYEIYFLNIEIRLYGKKDDIVSILPLGDLCGVTTEGLFYELCDDTLYFGAARGVSNVMTGESCHITVKSGCALVFKSRD